MPKSLMKLMFESGSPQILLHVHNHYIKLYPCALAHKKIGGPFKVIAFLLTKVS